MLIGFFFIVGKQPLNRSGFFVSADVVGGGMRDEALTTSARVAILYSDRKSVV